MANIIETAKKWRISSRFGWRNHPIRGGRSFHGGIDIACPAGTPIMVARDGVVTHKKWMRGYGNVVFVQHPNGLQTRYAHMRNFADIQPGMKIKEGAVLGYVGSTGESTGPHLHFETRVLGFPMDPAKILGKDFVLTGKDFLVQKGKYAPWAPAEKICKNPEERKRFEQYPFLEKPNWFQRNMPYPLGWSDKKLKQYDLQQELKREVFRGVTVGELKAQGMDDTAISKLRQLSQSHMREFLAGHAQANITLGEINRTVGNEVGRAVAQALRNDSRQS